MNYSMIVLLILSALSGVVFSQAPGPSQVARRRSIRSIPINLNSKEAKCPSPMTSCPIPTMKKLSNSPSVEKAESWECVNLQEELTSCGSCGNDCMSTPHADNVGCQAGKCKIFTCKSGYAIHRSMDTKRSMMVETCA